MAYTSISISRITTICNKNSSQFNSLLYLVQLDRLSILPKDSQFNILVCLLMGNTSYVRPKTTSKILNQKSLFLIVAKTNILIISQ